MNAGDFSSETGRWAPFDLSSEHLERMVSEICILCHLERDPCDPSFTHSSSNT